MRVTTTITHPDSDSTLVIDCDYTPGRPETGPSFSSAGGEPADHDDFDLTIYMQDDPEKQDLSAILARETLDIARDAVREKYAAEGEPDADDINDARRDMRE